jgi:hypothetical protein
VAKGAASAKKAAGGAASAPPVDESAQETNETGMPADKAAGVAVALTVGGGKQPANLDRTSSGLAGDIAALRSVVKALSSEVGSLRRALTAAGGWHRQHGKANGHGGPRSPIEKKGSGGGKGGAKRRNPKGAAPASSAPVLKPGATLADADASKQATQAPAAKPGKSQKRAADDTAVAAQPSSSSSSKRHKKASKVEQQAPPSPEHATATNAVKA